MLMGVAMTLYIQYILDGNGCTFMENISDSLSHYRFSCKLFKQIGICSFLKLKESKVFFCVEISVYTLKG